MKRLLRLALPLFVAFHLVITTIVGLGKLPTAKADTTSLRATWNELRADVRRAVRPWTGLTGTAQNWGMFAGTLTASYRVEIAAQLDGRWQDLYVERTPDARWRTDQLDHYRFREFRKGVKRRRNSRTWTPFVRWAGDAVLADFPAASAARVRIVRAKIPDPTSPEAKAPLVYDGVVKERVVRRAP